MIWEYSLLCKIIFCFSCFGIYFLIIQKISAKDSLITFCNQGKIIMDVYFVTMHIISLKLHLFAKDVLLLLFFFFFCSLFDHSLQRPSGDLWLEFLHTWKGFTNRRQLSCLHKVSVSCKNYQLYWDFEFILLVTCWTLWFFDWVSFFFYSEAILNLSRDKWTRMGQACHSYLC